MDDEAPGLGVGFAIEPDFSGLTQLLALMDSAEGRVLREAQSIEKATSGMVNLAGATAQVTTFGNAATRTFGSAEDVMQRAEKAAESFTRRLLNQNEAFGMTKAGAAAYRAEMAGATDAANELRAAEAANLALKADARLASDAKAARERAAAEAAVNAQLLERSRLEAALERTTGVGRVSATDAGATTSALAARERELDLLEQQAAVDRQIAQQTKQENNLLAEQANLQAAIERTTGVGRTPATSSGATFSALAARAADLEAQDAARRGSEAYAASLDREAASIGKTTVQLKAMEVEARAVEAEQKGMPDVAEQIRASYARLTVAQDQHTESAGLNRVQMMMLKSAAFNTYQSLAAGMPIMRVLAEQGAEVAQAFVGEGGASKALAEAGKAGEQAKTGSEIAGKAFDQLKDKATETAKSMVEEHGVGGAASKLWGILTPGRLVVGGVTAVVVAGTMAWLAYADALAKMNALAQGSGAVIGATGAELEAAAVQGAAAGNITVGAARGIVTGYVQMGNIGKPVLAGLTALTAEFAAATGTDAAEAQKELGAAFQDPAKGAEELTVRYGSLTQAQIDHIRQLMEQNDLYGAQAALLADLGPQFAHAAQQATLLGQAWTFIKNEASEAWNWMGKAINRLLTGGTTAEQLADLQQQRAMLLASNANGAITEIDQKIAAAKAKLAAEQSAAGVAGARSDAADILKQLHAENGDDQLSGLRNSLSKINGVLADTSNKAGLTAQGLALLRDRQDAYTHAVNTWISPAEKANEIAAIDAKIAAAKTPAQQRELASQKALIEQKGQLITKSQAEARAQSEGAKAAAQAQKTVDNAADAAARKEANHQVELKRSADAEEAQIVGLGKLAQAYGQSGAAALIAEATAKAEVKAIKDRGDAEAEVSRQIRLAVAERVSEAAKSTASMSAQASVQEQVNAQVEAGLIPQAKAAQVLQERMQLLPLLDAQEAARQARDQQGYDRATAGIEAETTAQLRLNASRVRAQVDGANASADNQLETLRAELTLIGATDAARVHGLATIKAQQDAVAAGLKAGTADYDKFVAKQIKVADDTQTVADATRHWNEQLGYVADSMARIHETAQLTSQSLSDAFGTAGKAAGDALTSITGYYAQQSRLQKEHDDAIKAAGADQAALDKANTDFQRGSDDARMSSLIGLTSAAKGFFKENSTGYKAIETAEKALTLVQLARTAVDVAGGAAKMFSELGPWAFPAVAAMLGVMASLGFSGGRGVSTADYTKGNTGTGTVLGDSTAQSASIKNAIEQLKNVDDATLTVSRNMLASLQSIENSLGGLATQLVRAGDINADAGIKTGTSSTTLSGIVKASVPLVGTFLGGVIDKLFGTKTTIVGNGLYGASQSVGDIVNGGFDASYYSDVEKKKKFFGITTSTKLSTQYSAADTEIEDQFTLLIKQFYDTIGQAAGPLGANLDAIDAKLQGFTVNIGKIDLKGLTGDQIEEKLEAVFGAAADDMAAAAFPGIEKFQKVGEGAFETLVRVSTTVEQVDAVFRKLGVTSTTMGVDVDMAVAGLFDSVSDFTSAAGTYFQDFFTKGEQATAESNQIARAMDALGLAMPDTLDGFRDLVQAQDLTTAAGQQTYATLLQLAPAFYDLKTNLEGAKSAADILSEQQDLQSKLWDLLGDTADIRAAELAKLDPSNRALQERIYAVQDAQDAAKAASDLADAWKSVGDNIMDEINRIRGLGDTASGASFAQLLGQFNAATAAARAGDQAAAGNLPALSKSLLDAAAQAATSRQELDRVQAQTAASLQTTYDTIEALSGQAGDAEAGTGAVGASAAASTGTAAAAANDELLDRIDALTAEVVSLRGDTNAALAAIAGNTGRTDKRFADVTAGSQGQAITVAAAA